MENIVFDSGIKEYRINEGGTLRFNPSDPNLYVRFLDAMDKVKAMEKELAEGAAALESSDDPARSGAAILRLMQEADCKIKAILTEVFGGDNDFDRILAGVNLLAMGSNGQRVIINLLSALEPILTAGAQSYADSQTQTAVARAKQNRAKRKAAQ